MVPNHISTNFSIFIFLLKGCFRDWVSCFCSPGSMVPSFPTFQERECFAPFCFCSAGSATFRAFYTIPRVVLRSIVRHGNYIIVSSYSIFLKYAQYFRNIYFRSRTRWGGATDRWNAATKFVAKPKRWREGREWNVDISTKILHGPEILKIRNLIRDA